MAYRPPVKENTGIILLFLLFLFVEHVGQDVKNKRRKTNNDAIDDGGDGVFLAPFAALFCLAGEADAKQAENQGKQAEVDVRRFAVLDQLRHGINKCEYANSEAEHDPEIGHNHAQCFFNTRFLLLSKLFIILVKTGIQKCSPLCSYLVK